MLRLGDDVARDGRISPVVGRPRGRERRAGSASSPTRSGAQEVIAKATSAIRTAANGSELVDRIEAETGVEVEVISGLEEARLIFAAVRASLVLEPAPALCVDIGGGSVEIMIGDAAGPALGHERAARRRPPHRRAACSPTRRRGPTATALEARIRDGARADRRRGARTRAADGGRDERHDQRPRAPGRGRATTATIPASANGLRIDAEPAPRAAAPHRADADRRTAPAARHRGEARRAAPGRRRRCSSTIFDVFEIDEMVTSDWALREGIVLDAVRVARSRRLVRRPARAAARRGRRASRAGAAPISSTRSTSTRLALEPVRPDAARCTGSATTTARCSSTRRSCTTSASTSRARATTGTPRTSSSTRNSAASRPTRSSSSPRSFATTGAATSRRRSRVRPRSTRSARDGCASSPRCCASPTGSTAAGAASSRTSTSRSAPTSWCCGSTRATTPSSSCGACAAGASCSRRSSSASSRRRSRAARHERAARGRRLTRSRTSHSANALGRRKSARRFRRHPRDVGAIIAASGGNRRSSRRDAAPRGAT